MGGGVWGQQDDRSYCPDSLHGNTNLIIQQGKLVYKNSSHSTARKRKAKGNHIATGKKSIFILPVIISPQADTAQVVWEKTPDLSFLPCEGKRRVKHISNILMEPGGKNNPVRRITKLEVLHFLNSNHITKLQ